MRVAQKEILSVAQSASTKMFLSYNGSCVAIPRGTHTLKKASEKEAKATKNKRNESAEFGFRQ